MKTGMKRGFPAVFLAALLAFGWTSFSESKEKKQGNKASSPHTDKHAHAEEEEGHEHGEEKAQAHEEGDSDVHEEGHEEKDEHGHGGEHEEHAEGGHESEEAPQNVGPDKGILTFSEKDGFTLSREAIRNFGIQTLTLGSGTSWNVAKSALLYSGDQVSVFRVRGGAYLRVPVRVEAKESTQVKISSRKLKEGDLIVNQGVAYLRIAELDVTSGESGHHH